MKLCKDCEGEAVGVFCRLYHFNGDNGCYLGNVYCVFHEEQRDPGDGCEDFICKKYKRIKPKGTK